MSVIRVINQSDKFYSSNELINKEYPRIYWVENDGYVNNDESNTSTRVWMISGLSKYKPYNKLM